MKDNKYVLLLQECLPRLRLRWQGFRKVRRMVFKRINRRLKELGLPNLDAYRLYLNTHTAEWPMLDSLCRIPISRFYRDKGVYLYLEEVILRELSEKAMAEGETNLSLWSIGCASGEEPYTLAILWKYRVAPQFPMLQSRILATDAEPYLIQRAQIACFPASSVRDLPEDWRQEVFAQSEDGFCLKPEYRDSVTFKLQDIRDSLPEGKYHLILCRNVVFTYFDDDLQQEILKKIINKLVPGGVLLIGKVESLPEGVSGLEPVSKNMGVYRRSLGSQR